MPQPIAWIFSNGEIANPDLLLPLIGEEDFLVAADGGLKHIFRLKLWPNLLIGDLDSVTAEDLAECETSGVKTLRYPPEKNETDLELAIQAVLSGEYSRIRIAGALGGRLDQTLGNLYLLTQPSLINVDIRLEDGREEVFLIRQSAVIEGQPGDTLSLLPINRAAHGILTHGLRYPLKNETLWPDHTRGISNELSEPHASVRLMDGLLLCIHTRR